MKTATAKRALFELRAEWQARADKQLDMEHVAHLVTVLADDRDLAPIRVVKLGDGSLAIVDGYHRFAAYVEAKRAVVPFEIVGKGEACILWHLAHANAENGRARAPADKREAVKRALAAPEGADMSNADIARWCAVSLDLVRSVRAEERGAPSAAAERKQILDGEREDTYDAATVSPRTAARAKAVHKPHDPSADRRDRRLAEDEPAKAERADWVDLADACDRIANAISALKREHSAELKAVPGAQEIVDLLDRARGIATKRKPHACPAPHNGGKCPICSNRGYTLGEYTGDWRAVVRAAHA